MKKRIMDWLTIPFEPNLKFTMELKEDLKTKYFEQHEKAKQTLENFSCSLQNIFQEHQKLLADNIELSIINEKLKQIINKAEFNQQKILSCAETQSEILGGSKNCNLQIVPKSSPGNKKLFHKISNDELIALKENINEFVPIFSSDFNTDIGNENFEKHKSPPVSVTNTPVKVQNSPIISKRKRFSTKKNSSSLSNTSNYSTTSSDDSKVNSTTIGNALEKNILEIDNESDKKSVKGTIKESTKEPMKVPLKTIENISLSSLSDTPDKNKGLSLLGVSKTNFGKTEFTESGKRLRQTTLTLKKVAPIIDISKIDSNESICDKNDTKFKIDSAWSETFYNSEVYNQHTSGSNEKQNKNKNLSELDINAANKFSKVKNISKDQSNNISTESQNTSAKEDELIETSPAQTEISKLRNKLSLNKKTNFNQIKVKLPSKIINEIVTNSESKSKHKSSQVKSKLKYKELKHTHQNYTRDDDNNEHKVSHFKEKVQNCFTARTEKRKSFEPQRTFSDDTYFSPAELGNNKNDAPDYDMTEFEDEIKCDTPPAKRMLLNSFDEIPGRREKSPDFAYKEAPVRKKNERAQLPGWDCRNCEKWYGHLPEEERKKRQNQCSRHRGKYKADILTPESFWNPVFNDTRDSSSFGDY